MESLVNFDIEKNSTTIINHTGRELGKVATIVFENTLRIFSNDLDIKKIITIGNFANKTDKFISDFKQHNQSIIHEHHKTLIKSTFNSISASVNTSTIFIVSLSYLAGNNLLNILHKKSTLILFGGFTDDRYLSFNVNFIKYLYFYSLSKNCRSYIFNYLQIKKSDQNIIINNFFTNNTADELIHKENVENMVKYTISNNKIEYLKRNPDKIIEESIIDDYDFATENINDNTDDLKNETDADVNITEIEIMDSVTIIKNKLINNTYPKNKINLSTKIII